MPSTPTTIPPESWSGDHDMRPERAVDATSARLPASVPAGPGTAPAADRVAAMVTAAAMLATAFLVVPGGLYIDDIRAQAYAAGRSYWPFVVESNGTHLAPGARTVDWVQSVLWPLEAWPAAVYTVVLVGALGAVVWRLLRELVPQTWAALVGLALALFGGSLVPSLAWYRQGLTTVTALVLTLAAIDAAARYVRTGRIHHAAVAAGAVALGLTFSERTLVAAVCVTWLGLLHHRAAPWWTRLRRTVVVVAPLVVLNLAFLAGYGSGDFDRGGEGTPTWGGLVVSTARSLFKNTIPSLLGGPVRWREAGASYAFAATPTWLVVLGNIVVVSLALLAWRSRRERPGHPGMVTGLVVAYAVPIYLIVYAGRISRADVMSVDDLRLYSDVGVFVAIAAAALLGAAVPERRPTGRPLVVAVAAATVVAVAIGVSWVGFARYWHRSTSTAYLQTLRADLATNRSPVLPTPVPDTIVPGWVQPDFSTSSLVDLLQPGTEMSLVDALPRVVAPDGHLVAGRLDPVATAVNTREDFCGNPLVAGADAVTIDFAEPVPYFRGSMVELKLLVSDTTRIRVTVTGEDGMSRPAGGASDPYLLRGPHTMTVPVPYTMRLTSVTVSRTRTAAGICVTGVRSVVPSQATR